MTYFASYVADTNGKMDKTTRNNLAADLMIYSTTNRGHEQKKWSERLRIRIDEFVASFEIDCEPEPQPA